MNNWLFEITTTFIKIVIVLGIAFNIPPIMIWVERRAAAMIQRRKGPNRVGIFKWRLWGLIQSLADTIKLLFKEEAAPKSANKIFYHIAPILGLIPSLLAICALNFGNDIIVWGKTIPLQVINLNVGFLFILAISGMGIYGIAIAGWASNNKFSLLGSLRASAQMISYEIPMGLSLIPIVLIFQSLDLGEITKAQSNLSSWGIFCAPISFFIFLITMFAETNRAPFDLAEGESELIAGFHTEFGSTKFALFYLSEFVNMFTLSCLCSTLFFGGWQLPLISYDTLQQLFGTNLASLLGTLTLLIKAAFFMWLFVWVRWTLPRFRYDQLMKLGWKFLLPLGLGNILVTSLILILGYKNG
jgi:NADH-quinone oxidoreductase subunit H